jgi:predicted enzyme related to lactoylglutathione lyase
MAEGGHFIFYFETDDVAAFAERIKTNGVTLVKGRHETDWHTREIVIMTTRATPYISASRFSRL